MFDINTSIKDLGRYLFYGEDFDCNKAVSNFHGQELLLSWLSAYYAHKNIDFHLWPTNVQKAYTTALVRNETLLAEYQQIAARLEKQNIKVIPLKGIWFLQEKIVQAGQRDFGDIDLWVEPGQLPQAQKAMEKLGYCKYSPIHDRLHFHSKMRKNIEPWPVIVELHKELSHQDFHQLKSREIWRGQNKAGLSPEDQLIYIFLHSALHFFDRPSRILDCVLTLKWAQQKKINWSLLRDKLDRWQLNRWFLLSLLMVEEVLQEELQSQFFNNSHLKITQKIKSSLKPQSYYQRFNLADSKQQGLVGLLHPKRILGGLVDRLE